MPEITHKYDCDSGLVEIFIDGKEVVCWSCEDREGMELSIQDFNKIFNLGAKSSVKKESKISIIKFVYSMMIYIIENGIVDKNDPILYEIHRFAQNYCKDEF